MVKINLLGKKATPAPFGLDSVFEKIGFKPEELGELRPGLIRIVVLLVLVYLANFVPTYLQQMKIKDLDAKVQVINDRKAVLQAELNAKKEFRKQMDQLNKEEVELQRQLNAINGLNRDRGLAFRTMDHIVSSVSSKVWITKSTYKNKAVQINGSSWEYFPINDFVKTITEFSQYTNVVFKWIRAEAPLKPVTGVPLSAQKVKNFELEFRVKGTGDTQ